MEIQSNEEGRDESDRTSGHAKREALVRWTNLLVPPAIHLLKLVLTGEPPSALEDSGDMLDLLFFIGGLTNFWQGKRSLRRSTGEKE